MTSKTDPWRRRLLSGACAAGLLQAGSGASAFSFPAFAKRDFDVIVIGGGAAGLSAAVEAAQGGANVVLLEKEREIGGDTMISSGFFSAVDEQLQRRSSVEDTVEFFFEQMYAGGGMKADPELVRVVAANAFDSLTWLESLGMRFQKAVFESYGGEWPRSHKPVLSAGSGYIRTLSTAAVRAGVRIERGTAVSEFIMDRTGRVRGVIAGRGRQRLEYRAGRGVVIASGGFGRNSGMVARYAPPFKGLTSDNSPGSTGEILEAAAAIGVGLRDMDFIQCLPGCPPGRSHGVLLHSDVSRFIFVNRKGERFINEDATKKAICDAVLALPERHALTVVDTAGLESFNLLIQKGAWLGIETGDAWCAETVEDLARMTGLPPAGLCRTVAAYNTAVREKRDSLGRRRESLMHEISKAPFWACYAGMTVHYTMGGVSIDRNARCLRGDGSPVAGLYAAGEATGGVHGNNRLGGCGLADAVVFGRVAGRNAAREQAS